MVKLWRRFLHWIWVGIILAISLGIGLEIIWGHTGVAAVVQRDRTEMQLETQLETKPETQLEAKLETQSPPLALSALSSIEALNPTEFIQQGKAFYQSGQFLKAATLWQQAADRFAAQGDRLNQALALSYVATAYEQLSQWHQANAAIEMAIEQLNALDPLKRSPQTAQILAQVQNAQANLQFTLGQAAEALATWQAAEATYRSAVDAVGALGSQINQAKALQALGFYRRAVALLQQIEQTLQQQPDSSLKAIGLRDLGTGLRRLGDLDQSRAVLQQSLAIVERLRALEPSHSAEPLDDSIASSILLSLGNTARLQGEVAPALAFYQQAVAIAPSPALKIQAQLGQLSLLAQAEPAPPEYQATIQTLLPQIQSQLAKLPASHTGIYARIHLAELLTQLNDRPTRVSPEISSIVPAHILAIAVQQARELGDRRAESYGLGTLGHLYEQTQQRQEARALTQQALNLAEEINAVDVAYQWQWQLGRLAQGEQNQEAIAAYSEAVRMLQSLRTDLVAIHPDVQFSFRDSVEPVYRQFVELLLQAPLDAQPDAQPSQDNLKQARTVIEWLQLAELDNFFREVCVTASPVPVDTLDPEAAVLYPILLPDRLAIILSLPDQPLRYYKTLISTSEVEQLLDKLRQSLRPTSFTQERLPIAQQGYNLLIRPAAADLAASGVKTLVFIPDGILQNIPMAMLHDGQRYLIEQYRIALTPGLQLLQPQPIARQTLKGLVAGLSQPRQGFAALPNVATEVDQIETEISAEVLLDRAFTSTTFQAQINSTAFSIVHLATHGRFSSNAAETFILTWDGQINVKQLDQLLRTREQGGLSPIELLVLSACETAVGDRRSALGMAGVAVRSGARSTLASLWAVSDRSTAALMVEFYQQLRQPDVTKAEALRRAQIALLQQPQYAHPYYWAPFVLLGNWL